MGQQGFEKWMVRATFGLTSRQLYKLISLKSYIKLHLTPPNLDTAKFIIDSGKYMALGRLQIKGYKKFIQSTLSKV